MTTTDKDALAILEHAAEQVRALVHLRPAWTDPAALYDAAGLLDEVTHTLHTVIGHSGRCCDRLASCVDLSADDLGEPTDAASLAYSASVALETAAQTLHTTNAEIRSAHAHLSRLYLDTPDDGATV